ncbi:hypothetical protein GN157_05635 [Flavobacterium rakeshii]|uniref:Uncharacterized protein n=1 Tax=Flavobacterium rakeshii TaxID=1038845 RepID=A0A6N8HD09_9FLAO|nr:hypothetical protein [Flavobacterium rakeshii]MUV03186.1 hypothetical protein [Flavobacterium rakeshii]
MITLIKTIIKAKAFVIAKAIATVFALGIVITASYIAGGYLMVIASLMCIIIGAALCVMWKLKI